MKEFKVRWNIKDPIQKLDQLAEKTQKTSRRIKGYFEDGGKSVNKYGKSLKKLTYALGGADFSAKGMITTIGGSVTVLGAAAAAIAAVAAQMIDLPELTRDATETMEAYNSALERQLEIRNEISTFKDKVINEEFQRQIRGLKLRQVETTEKQVEVDIARQAAKEKLVVMKDYYKKVNDLAKKSADRRKKLEDKLAERTKQNLGDEIARGKRPEQAIVDLTSKAQQAARSGQIELAEELIDKAQELSDELGNHVFFTDKIASANKAVDDQLRKQIARERAIEGTVGKRADRAKDAIAQQQELVKGLDKQYIQLTNILKLLAAEAKEKKVAAKEAKVQQIADEGARTFQTGVRKFSLELTEGDRGTFQNFRDSLKQTLAALTGIERRDLGIQGVEQGAGLVEKIFRTLTDKDTTAGEVIGLEDEILKLSEVVGGLEVLLGKGTIGEEFRADFERLQRFLEGAQQALRGAGDFGSTRGLDTAIAEGVASPFDKYGQKIEQSGGQIKTLGDQASNAADALGRISQLQPKAAIPVQTATQPTRQEQPLPSALAATPTNINVEANIKGGIIDGEVARELTGLINRQIRQALSSGVNSIA